MTGLKPRLGDRKRSRLRDRDVRKTIAVLLGGKMVGRTSFKGDLVYSAAVSGLIYPIFGHWVSVVHTVGGFIALAGAIVLGPRIGRKFKRDGGGPLAPHDMNIAAIGGVILWFGWYGFNPGSTLSAMDWTGIGRVAANTTLAASAGGMVAVLFVYPRSKKWDVGMSINGFLGGLVAVTTPCYWVSPAGQSCWAPSPASSCHSVSTCSST